MCLECLVETAPPQLESAVTSHLIPDKHSPCTVHWRGKGGCEEDACGVITPALAACAGSRWWFNGNLHHQMLTLLWWYNHQPAAGRPRMLTQEGYHVWWHWVLIRVNVKVATNNSERTHGSVYTPRWLFQAFGGSEVAWCCQARSSPVVSEPVWVPSLTSLSSIIQSHRTAHY